MRGVLLGIAAISLRPLNSNGEAPTPEQPTIWLPGVTEAGLETIYEAGQRTPISVDGVGVIDVSEEDDTLIGVDLTVSGVQLDLNALLVAVGGTVSSTEGVTTGWTAPTITQQRDDRRRLETDVYVRAIGSGGQTEGYLRHRLYFCRGTMQGLSHSIRGVVRPAMIVKARPHPSTKLVNSADFVASVPDHE